MITHIRYMRSAVAICHEPEGLGTDFVVKRSDPDDPNSTCLLCLSFLLVHSSRSVEDKSPEAQSEFDRSSSDNGRPDFYSGVFFGMLIAVLALLLGYFSSWIF